MRGEAKFLRAQAHLADLSSLLDQYRTQVTDALFVVSAARDGGIEYRRGDVPAPPMEIALAFGDFLQAARASLDHAVYAISTAVQPGYVKEPCFPIAPDEQYERAAAKALKYVPVSEEGWELVGVCISGSGPWGSRLYTLRRPALA